jgi:hypothetical protein
MITPYGTDDCLFSTGDAATNASRERKRAFGVIILRKTTITEKKLLSRAIVNMSERLGRRS